MAEKRTAQGLVVGLIPEETAQEAPPAKKPAAKSGKGGKNKPPKTATETGKTDETSSSPAGEGEKQKESDTSADGEGE